MTVLGDDFSQFAVAYGDGQWADLANEPMIGASIDRAVFLPFGTRQGNPTIELLVRTERGLYVHANTTWALWQAATTVFAGWAKR